MSYTINKTDGTAFVTPTMPGGALLDGTADTTSGLTLIGRNYTGFGEVQNENFVRLLENFASSLPPTSSVTATLPLRGTLWWDTASKFLKVYDGSNFVQVNGRITSNSAPTATNTGDQWWDTYNQQLNSWNGTSWMTVGPNATVFQGKSGTIVESIVDNTSVSRQVVNTYNNGTLIAITSNIPFTPGNLITNFPATLAAGITISTVGTFNGVASDSSKLGGLLPNVFARQDINQTFASDISVTGKLVLTNANIYVGNNALVLQNKNVSGNVELYVNLPITGNVKALTIDGSSGLLYTYGDPISTKGVATKGYVDSELSTTLIDIGVTSAQLNANIDALQYDTTASIEYVISSTNANLIAVQAQINSNVAVVAANLVTVNNTLTANVASIVANLGAISAALPSLAPSSGPVFTGTVIVPLATPLSNNSVAASTQYVDTRAFILNADYQLQINNLATATAQNLVNAVTPKANIAAPVFTTNAGTYPQSVTPEADDNTNKIATTAFVSGAISATKFNYTVATSGPGNVSGIVSSTNNAAGNDGDFWFTIG